MNMLRRISEELRERLIRSFMDLVILKELRNSAGMSGYDIITSFRRKFYTLPSPGTVYSVMYAMERKELVEGIVVNRKRVYKLTKKGEEKITNILLNIENVHLFVESMFGK